jgi:hypothetical protein
MATTSSCGRLAAVVVALAVAGCAVIGGVAPPVQGSGVVKSEERPVAGFTAVTLAGVGNVTVEIADTEGLTVKAEDNILPLLTSEVKDGTLVLGTVPNASFNATKPIEFHVRTKALTGLTVSGTGNATARQVKAGKLTVTVNGTGNVTLAGTADELEATVAGTGNVQAEGLAAKRVKARVNGTGSAVVNATESLDATVAGVGSVEYTGNPPQVRESVSGVGKVRKR